MVKRKQNKPADAGLFCSGWNLGSFYDAAVASVL
jgi:hypothetical protein